MRLKPQQPLYYLNIKTLNIGVHIMTNPFRYLSTAAVLILFLRLLVPADLCFAQAQEQSAEATKDYLESMDTLITLTVYGNHREEALQKAREEILRLDDLLSIGNPDSEVSRVNRDKMLVLSEDTGSIVQKAMELYHSTDGLFDITILPLMQLWGFTSGLYHVPSPQELSAELEKVDAGRLDYDPVTRVLTLDAEQCIDLGGIAKGFTSQRIMEIFKQCGVTSGLVSLGGNVQCLNRKPDGSDYIIAIRNPFGEDKGYAATLSIHNEAVITSGGYERYFTDEATGKIYQHIMDPHTGIPAESDLASVSIITTDGMLGDGLSTSLYIMGKEDAIQYWKEHHTEFQMILVDIDGNVLVTEGLENRIRTPEQFNVILS